MSKDVEYSAEGGVVGFFCLPMRPSPHIDSDRGIGVAGTDDVWKRHTDGTEIVSVYNTEVTVRVAQNKRAIVSLVY